MSAGENGAVSVVVPVRDGAAFLAEAIASASGQTRPPAEIVVVDDGSTDGSREIAVAGGARCVPSPGRGQSAARNHGVSVARSSLVAFLDHDDVWLPEKLERQVPRLLGDARLGFVTARARVRMEPGAVLPPSLRPAADGTVTGVLTSTLLARRSALDEVGGFDPRFTIAGDYDWLVRAREVGVAGEELAEALVEYRIHATNLSHRREVIDAELFGALRASVRRRGGREGPVGRSDS